MGVGGRAGGTAGIAGRGVVGGGGEPEEGVADGVEQGEAPVGVVAAGAVGRAGHASVVADVEAVGASYALARVGLVAHPAVRSARADLTAVIDHVGIRVALSAEGRVGAGLTASRTDHLAGTVHRRVSVRTNSARTGVSV